MPIWMSIVVIYLIFGFGFGVFVLYVQNELEQPEDWKLITSVIIGWPILMVALVLARIFTGRWHN